MRSFPAEPAANQPVFEQLESRRLLTASPFISEFMAVNDNGRMDQDGDRSDWIEIYNPDTQPASLNGWHLTDEIDNTVKWTFPNVTIPAGQYLMVFASGKNRALAGTELHTNFTLDGASEYLGLTGPGGTVVSSFGAVYPPQKADVSYGPGMGLLVGPATPLKVVVPFDSSYSSAWTGAGYVDNAWLSGVGGVGYDVDSTFTSLIGVDVKTPMRDANASCYIRAGFSISDLTKITALTLRMKYDDGFVAYLNGTEVARRNAPSGTPSWNAGATAQRGSDSLATTFEDINITSFISQLRVGQNVLAIQGLNGGGTGNSDFLIVPELKVATSSPQDAGYLPVATPGIENGMDFQGFVADTKFNLARGFYSAPINLTITSATAGAQIRYTTDGSEPTASTGAVYTGPIQITTTKVIRAGAFKTGFVPTNVDTETYIYVNDVVNQSNANVPASFPTAWTGRPRPNIPDYYPGGGANTWSADYAMDPNVVNSGTYSGEIRNDLKSIPTLSLVVDPNDMFGLDGIYTNPEQKDSQDVAYGLHIAWERPMSAELIYPDGRDGFQIDGGVQIHGGYSRNPQNTAKHTFTISFKDEYGPTKLHFPLFDDSSAASDFDALVLRAGFNDSYGYDAAGQAQYIRDQWYRDVQSAMGDVASHGDFVHLYVNGVYWGLYNPVERIDADFMAEYYGGNDSDYDVIKGEWLDQPGVAVVVDGNKTAWDAMISMANSKSGDTLYRDIQQYLDIPNFIDYMILNIYGGTKDWPMNNWAAGRNRTGGGFKFFAWDSEISLDKGNSDNTGMDDYGDTPSHLYYRLKTSPEFKLQFADRVYKSMYNNGPLSAAGAASIYSALASEIAGPMADESARWGDMRGSAQTRNGQWTSVRNSLLNSYFPGRTNVVLGQLRNAGLYPSINAPSFNQNGGNIPSGFKLTMSGSGGTIYYTTNGLDPRDTTQPTGLSPSAKIYNPANADLTLTKNTHIKARALSGSTWSALDEASFVVDPGMLKITELMYNPPSDNDDLEFVELLNSASQAMDVSGVHFTQGIDYTFPANTTVLAGQRVVLVHFNPAIDTAKASAFRSTYHIGVGVRLMGPYTGVLGNAGEQIQMQDASGNILADFTYADSGDWPGRADGKGSSLELANLTLPFANLYADQNWRPSAEYNGTPGSAGTGELYDVQINEVLTHTDLPQSDSVELHNNTDSPIDISGWYLSDNSDNYLEYRIPDGTILPARGYVVFDESDINPTPLNPGPNDFTFNGAHGEEVYLLTKDPATGQPLRFVDHVSFGGAFNGVSFGRVPNGTGELVPAQRTTLGYDNSYAAIGPVIISEVMYYPPALTGGIDDTDNEFIELYNPTGAAVTLSTWFDNHGDPASFPWKLGKGIDYTFPIATSIPSHGAIVVVGFDPVAEPAKLTAFRTKYGIGTGVTVLGPWVGKLSNTDESVALFRPDEPPADEPGFVPYVLMDEAAYDVSAPWSSPGSGTGQSMQRKQWMLVGDQGGNWIGGAPTPGSASFPSATPPAVGAVGINNGQPQRSIVTSLSLTFSKDVGSTLSAGDLVIHNLTTGADLPVSALAMSYNSVTRMASWTFAGLPGGTLARGGYIATLSPGLVADLAGSPLDGNGDGVAGDDYTLTFHCQPGDANGDAAVDVGDLGILGANYGLVGLNQPGDLNGDGQVDVGDLGILGANYGAALPASGSVDQFAAGAIESDPTTALAIAPLTGSASMTVLASPMIAADLAAPAPSSDSQPVPAPTSTSPASPTATANVAGMLPWATLAEAAMPLDLEAGLVDVLSLFQLEEPLAV